MNARQKAILEAAKKTTLKNEGTLTGGSKYINPKKKSLHKKKKG